MIIECNASEIPLGSIIEQDIINDKNILLIKKGTIYTEKLAGLLKSYDGIIRIELVDIDGKEKDKLLNKVRNETDVKSNKIDEQLKTYQLSDPIKKRVVKSVELMYMGESSELIDESSRTVTEALMSSLNNSKSASISLDILKVSDEYTFKHSVDVGAMSLILSKELGESREFMEHVALAGILHDIGKSKVPLEILNKASKLDDEEWKIMQMHPIYGFQMICKIDNIPKCVKEGVIQHHEAMDGSGYPLGLKGDKIGKIAKILTIADVYDALVTQRPYKEAKSPSVALEILMGMFNKFDINMLTTFIKCIILYPVGSEIELSNGAHCVVVKNNKGYPLRPLCENIETGERYDLLNDLKCLSLVIK